MVGPGSGKSLMPMPAALHSAAARMPHKKPTLREGDESGADMETHDTAKAPGCRFSSLRARGGGQRVIIRTKCLSKIGIIARTLGRAWRCAG